MHPLAAALALLALAGCSSRPAPVNCSPRPADFARWNDVPARGIDVLVNTIRVGRDGGVRWNGVDLGNGIDTSAFAVLDQYLAVAAQLEPMPATVLVFDKGVPCASVTRVRAIMRRRLGCGRNAGKCVQGMAPGHAR